MAGGREKMCCAIRGVGARRSGCSRRLRGEVERLGGEGVKEMLVVPISFVTEHIETLHEINIEARAEAAKFGVQTFRMMPAVGDSPLFIAALKDLVLRAVGIETAEAGEVQASSMAS